MITEYQLRISPEQAYNEENIKSYISKEKGIDLKSINSIRIIKRSIDARHSKIFINLKVRTFINEIPDKEYFTKINYPNVSNNKQVIVVGAGPAGLFAALKLIELNLCPIVIERGKNVRERKKDLAQISKTQTINENSNYCFGEGGAGAYSDGKLYTRSKKTRFCRTYIKYILPTWCLYKYFV